MGDQRIRDAAASNRATHRARSYSWKTIRTYAGDSTADWKIPARRDRPGSARRKNRVDRLRCDSSGWGNAHRFYHRGLCSVGAGIRTDGGGGNLAEFALD